MISMRRIGLELFSGVAGQKVDYVKARKYFVIAKALGHLDEKQKANVKEWIGIIDDIN